jgi:hypothetical protein
LLRSRPGGVQKELIVEDLPTANVRKDISSQKIFSEIIQSRSVNAGNQLILKPIIFNEAGLKYSYCASGRQVFAALLCVQPS